MERQKRPPFLRIFEEIRFGGRFCCLYLAVNGLGRVFVGWHDLCRGVFSRDVAATRRYIECGWLFFFAGAILWCLLGAGIRRGGFEWTRRRGFPGV